MTNVSKPAERNEQSNFPNLLFPGAHDLNALSQEVGGLVYATYSYLSQSDETARRMAAQIATGQTLGYIPDDINKYWQYVGRVVSYKHEGQRAVAEIAFPKSLFGHDIAGMLTVLFGKISFSPGIRLESLRADSLYLAGIKGPKFGMDGLRKILGETRNKKPLLMAILKPGLGPSDDPIARQFSKLVSAGTHLVKDDETRIDITLNDALDRLRKVLSAGQGKGIYVTHLSGPAFEIKSRALALQSAGAQAFLFCPYTYGISLTQALCEDPEIKVPIFAHPAFTGVMGEGSSSIAPEVSLGTLLRWAGCDGVLFPSPYGSIALEKKRAQAVHYALIKDEGDLKMTASIPSAGIMPEFVERIRQDFGENVIVNAGTGMARVGAGVEDGAKSFTTEINKHYV